jgi:hypothetical protein
MDASYLHTFLQHEDKDLKFASCQLDDGVGDGARFGTSGGGANATIGRSKISKKW